MDVVLNWLWQGGVVALATAAILRVVPRSQTQARYRLVWAGCAAVLVLPAIPLLWAASAPPGDGTPWSSAPLVAMPVRWWTSGTTALALWAVWAVGYAGCIGAAVLMLRQARMQAREFPNDRETRLPHWARLRTTGRRARLMLSTRVRTAALLGGGTPVIAVAPTLVDQLSDADLDRVVIHEWAHVQRRDDLAQIALLFVRVVAGWHPAVWWLARQLHLEREVACDEMAIAVTGSAKAYATCLTTLAAMPPARVRRAPALAALSSFDLRQRVTRILAVRPAVSARAWCVAPVTAALVVGALALLVGRLHVVDTVFASTGLPRAAVADRILAVLPYAPMTARADDAARPRGAPTAARSQPAPSGARVERPQDAAVAQPIDFTAASLSAETPLTGEASELPDAVLSDTPSEAPISPSAAAAEPRHMPVWGEAVEAGKAIGAGSEQAAVATAGFFTRFGKKIARTF
ncbi:MAG: hypothetical protein HYY76_15415 [Acidobacteria bacterium]|nr:hypothetical protein [Acidobacteriota bacterium]